MPRWKNLSAEMKARSQTTYQSLGIGNAALNDSITQGVEFAESVKRANVLHKELMRNAGFVAAR